VRSRPHPVRRLSPPARSRTPARPCSPQATATVHHCHAAGTDGAGHGRHGRNGGSSCAQWLAAPRASERPTVVLPAQPGQSHPHAHSLSHGSRTEVEDDLQGQFCLFTTLSLSEIVKMNILMGAVFSSKESRFHNGTRHILELAVFSSILDVCTASQSKICLKLKMDTECHEKSELQLNLVYGEAKKNSL